MYEIQKAQVMFNHTQNLDLTSDEVAIMQSWLDSLSMLHICQFILTKNVYNIQKAISYQEQVIFSNPAFHKHLPFYLIAFSYIYILQFKHSTETLENIQKAILYQRQAVISTSVDHASLPMLLSMLSMSYAQQFEYTKYLPDIQQAIFLSTTSCELNSCWTCKFGNLAQKSC